MARQLKSASFYSSIRCGTTTMSWTEKGFSVQRCNMLDTVGGLMAHPTQLVLPSRAPRIS